MFKIRNYFYYKFNFFRHCYCCFFKAEAEMRRKMDLIHQIKAMEAVPIIRQKLVDFTELAGHGLLSEMSIAEVSYKQILLTY
jgi:hypothetical protein